MSARKAIPPFVWARWIGTVARYDPAKDSKCKPGDKPRFKIGSKLTAVSRLVLINLADRANGLRLCFPSATRIAFEEDISPRAAQSAIAQIEAFGLISMITDQAEKAVAYADCMRLADREQRGDTTKSNMYRINRPDDLAAWWDAFRSTQNLRMSARATYAKSAPPVEKHAKSAQAAYAKSASATTQNLRTNLLRDPTQVEPIESSLRSERARDAHAPTRELPASAAEMFAGLDDDPPTPSPSPPPPVEQQRLKGVPTPVPDARRPRRTRLPTDWQPDETLRQYARDHGIDPDLAAEDFRNHFHGEGVLKADWAGTWRNNVLRCVDHRRFQIRDGSVVPIRRGYDPNNLTGAQRVLYETRLRRRELEQEMAETAAREARAIGGKG